MRVYVQVRFVALPNGKNVFAADENSGNEIAAVATNQVENSKE